MPNRSLIRAYVAQIEHIIHMYIVRVRFVAVPGSPRDGQTFDEEYSLREWDQSIEINDVVTLEIVEYARVVGYPSKERGGDSKSEEDAVDGKQGVRRLHGDPAGGDSGVQVESGSGDGVRPG